MSNLVKRLDAHFIACAAAAGAAVVGTTQNAEAGIVSSGPVNISIPLTTAGVYLNVVTGVNGPAPAGVPGWDVNPFSSGNISFFNPTAPAGGVYSRGGGASGVGNLPVGHLIDATNLWTSGNFSPTPGWTLNLNSTNNIVGFRFQNEANGNATHFGWMRIQLSAGANTLPRAIVEYAYENVAGVGIPAGVPAPGSAALLALGALGLAGRRRK